jgi:beta-aspartyl-peptidase (threonine type)
VGACAVDVATARFPAPSTGGLLWKRSGRVGDTPLVGAGSFAEAAVGAASATGHGESIMRALMTHFAVARLRAGDSPAEAARAAVAELVARTGGTGGIIIVDAAGQVGHFTATRRMPWAAIVARARQSGTEP